MAVKKNIFEGISEKLQKQKRTNFRIEMAPNFMWKHIYVKSNKKATILVRKKIWHRHPQYVPNFESQFFTGAWRDGLYFKDKRTAMQKLMKYHTFTKPNWELSKLYLCLIWFIIWDENIIGISHPLWKTPNVTMPM